MYALDVTLYAFAAGFFALAAINPKPLSEYQTNLIALGLLCFALLPLIALLRQ